MAERYRSENRYDRNNDEFSGEETTGTNWGRTRYRTRSTDIEGIEEDYVGSKATGEEKEQYTSGRNRYGECPQCGFQFNRPYGESRNWHRRVKF